MEAALNVLIGPQDQEQLWSVPCKGSEIVDLLLDPPVWAKKVQEKHSGLYVQLADLSKHPDITIIFIYPFGDSDKSHDAEGYVVEGVGCTNLITVRAPHNLSTGDLGFLNALDFLRGANIVDAVKAFPQTTGQVNVAIRQSDNLAYYHFELSKDISDKPNVIRNAVIAVMQPGVFLDTLNQKAELHNKIVAGPTKTKQPAANQDQVNVYIVGDEKPANESMAPPRIRVSFDTLQTSPASAKEASASQLSSAAIDRLRFVYQWHDRERFNCTCCKAAATATEIEKDSYRICTDLIAFVCYACPQPSPFPGP